MSQLGYTWYPKDFISDPDVMFMTAAERGVYRDIIDLAYMSGNRIKYTPEMLAKYTNSDTETVIRVLDMKGKKVGDFWSIPSCDKRIDLAEKNRKNGAKGGRPKTQTKPKQNPQETDSDHVYETQTERQRERERESKNDYVVKETTTLNGFGYVSDHETLKTELKKPSSWKDMFGKQAGIVDPNDRDEWIDEFVEHAIADGKGDVILKVSEAQSWITNWVRKRIQAGENPKSRRLKVSSSDHLAAVAGIPLN